MCRWLPLWFLGVLALCVACPQSLAAPTFEPWRSTSISGVPGMNPSADTRVPVWWDVTLDGQPDLLLCSLTSMTHLRPTATGGIEEVPVSLPGSGGVLGTTFAALDIDGDGVDELMSFGQTTSLYRVEASHTLSLVDTPLPAVRSRSVSDAAVGDINRDGLPDVYVALGRGTTDRLNFSGLSDLILMNRGGGHFEVVERPPRQGLTLGVGLADIDRDGRLDVLESVDTSTIAGPGRLLLNRSEPGALYPEFEVSEHVWDVGTHGMGLAIEDVDQDGYLDIYNASTGQDLLTFGRADGSFEDQTQARGVLHQWASLGLRVQWSPSIADLDLDGRLDLIVRHGLPHTFTTTAEASWAADLVYAQGGDGRFVRTESPSIEGEGEGQRFALGDLEGDGRPDAGRDGQPDDVLLWRNTTLVSQDTPRLTLRFAPTVSPSPPVGARVVGRCGELSLTRHLTSGGKMGALAAHELYFAWPGCQEATVTLEVHWPSGALTTETVEVQVRSWQASEPRWIETREDGTLHADPSMTGASEVCAMDAAGDWACCPEPCQVAPGARQVRLDDRAALALPSSARTWLLVTHPPLPRPGSEVTLFILYQGSPEAFPEQGVVLRHAGEVIPWSDVDAEAQRLEGRMVVPSEGVGSLTLQLEVEGVLESEWTRPVGYVFSASDAQVSLFPVRPTGTLKEDEGWEVQVYSAPGVMALPSSAAWSVTQPSGEAVSIASQVSSGDFHLTTLRVDWADLQGVDALEVRDHPSAPPLTLSVVQPENVDALSQEIASAECGLVRTRAAPSHETIAGVVTLYDASGNVMTAPSRIVDLVVEGGSVTDTPHGSLGLKDMTFEVRVGESEGPGRVIVQSDDGVPLGECHFQVNERPAQTPLISESWATISRTELDRSAYQTTRLRVGVVNAHGELLGADAWPTVTLSGGEWLSRFELSAAGVLSGDIGPVEGEDTVRVTVTLEGELLETFQVAVVGESPSGEAGEGGGEIPDEEGCEGAGGAPLSWSMLLLWLILLGFKRRIDLERESISTPRRQRVECP